MASYFRQSRNVELSTIYLLETQLASDWSGVNVVKSFTQAYEVELPVVCIRLTSVPPKRKEIGSTTLMYKYMFRIDIFAKSDGQRLDLADYIVDKIKSGWTYYTWSHQVGNNSVLEKTDSGKKCHIQAINDNSRLDLGDIEVENPDRFRHQIVFDVFLNV